MSKHCIYLGEDAENLLEVMSLVSESSHVGEVSRSVIISAALRALHDLPWDSRLWYIQQCRDGRWSK